MQAAVSESPVVAQAMPEAIINNESKFLETFSPGDVSAQGDLYLVCLERLPRSAVLRENRQLADGDTKGSRHIMTRGQVYDCAPAEMVRAIQTVLTKRAGKHRKNKSLELQEMYMGPVIVSDANPTKDDLQHPEHGNQGFQAGCVVAVVYQRSLTADQIEARNRD